MSGEAMPVGEQAVVRKVVHYFGSDGFIYSDFDRWVARLPGQIVALTWGGGLGFIAITEDDPLCAECNWEQSHTRHHDPKLYNHHPFKARAAARPPVVAPSNPDSRETRGEQ